MEELKKFIIDNSTQIWTLISVVVGGVVTYISTSAQEYRKNKRQYQIKNLEQVLIPYCTCLEQTIDCINQIFQESAELFTNQKFEKCINSLSDPLVYLEAAKRVFLPQSMRKKLENYKLSVDTFSTAIEKEYTDCIQKYKNYISSKLENFTTNYIEIMPDIDKNVNVKVKTAIIKKSNLSLINHLSKIYFITSYGSENDQYMDIPLNKDIRDKRDLIRYGYIDISDIEDSNIELACSLLDYIEKNITDEREVLNQIIDETQSSNLLRFIIEELNGMIDELLKTIDNITK